MFVIVFSVGLQDEWFRSSCLKLCACLCDRGQSKAAPQHCGHGCKPAKTDWVLYEVIRKWQLAARTEIRNTGSSIDSQSISEGNLNNPELRKEIKRGN